MSSPFTTPIEVQANPLQQPSWEPFVIAKRAALPRSPRTLEGLGDRLRIVAFAEKQAEEAFLWATHFYPEASEAQKKHWLALAEEEKRHGRWLLERLKALSLSPSARPVSLRLWQSLIECPNAETFSLFMANAEERGRIAGLRFYELFKTQDPVTAALFRTIAEEEQSHIQVHSEKKE